MSHFQRIRAEKLQASVRQTAGERMVRQERGIFAVKRDIETALPEFERDADTLHGLPLEARLQLKRNLVEKWRAHCLAFEAAEVMTANPIYSHWVVWLFDIGEIPDFLEHCGAAILLGQNPAFLKRSLSEFRLWSLLEWSEGEFEAGRSPEPYFSTMLNGWPEYPAQAQGRYLTLAFKLALDEGDDDRAEKLGKLAAQHGGKVKTLLAKLRKRLAGK